MCKIINDYLIDNQITDFFNYSLSDNGNGNIYISEWNYEINKPNFSSQEIILSILSQEKIIKLNKNRENFCLIPIEYNGNSFATTLEAKNAISFLGLSLQQDQEVEYPNYPQGDNISLSKNDFLQLASLIQTREMTSRNLRKQKIDEINACETLHQLNQININFN